MWNSSTSPFRSRVLTHLLLTSNTPKSPENWLCAIGGPWDWAGLTWKVSITKIETSTSCRHLKGLLDACVYSMYSMCACINLTRNFKGGKKRRGLFTVTEVLSPRTEKYIYGIGWGVKTLQGKRNFTSLIRDFFSHAAALCTVNKKHYLHWLFRFTSFAFLNLEFN